MTPPSWTLTARWILPVSSPPLERGTVTVAGGVIESVHPDGVVPADLDLGHCAVMPGLVNAHTHLDLSGLSQRIPYHDFPSWLRGVIAHRRRLTPMQVSDHVRAGIAESLAHGVTLVGDIAGQGLSWPLLCRSHLRSVVYYELIGLQKPRAGQSWAAFLEWLRRHTPTPTCRPGLSPHAPYTVRGSLFRACFALAGQRRLPLAVHLAETRDEMDLLRGHPSSLSAFLAGIGAWADDGALVRSCDEVLSGVGDLPAVVLAHGNYLDPASPLPSGAGVVYCPRTHAHFRHPEHPFRELLARGVRVALGTDSRASNPDLDLLAEARFVHQLYPQFPCAALLRMATLAGAEVLGWGDTAGSLSAGKSADLVVVPLPRCDDEPERLVLGSTVPVRGVMCRGRWVVRPDSAGHSFGIS
jgi:cytosine/adenosine deaminase-related metal-dependent hydrolase